MSADATLLIIERLLEPSSPVRDVALSALEMLEANGGRERSTAEYAALLAAAGLRCESVTTTTSDMSLLQVSLAPAHV